MHPFHRLYAPLLAVLFPGTRADAAREIATPSAPIDQGTFTVYMENDLFAGTDRYYTSGVKLSRSSATRAVQVDGGCQGLPRKDRNFSRQTHADWSSKGVVKFERTVDVPLSEDAHLIADNDSLESIATSASAIGRREDRELPCAPLCKVLVVTMTI